MKKTDILGVRISTFNKEGVLKKIKEFLSGKKGHFIVTPNPEIILNARLDEELFYILNSADLSIPDGTGIKFAGFLNFKNIKRITGADLIKDIIDIAIEKKQRIGILNWKKGFSNAEDLQDIFKEKYPELNFMVEDISRDKHTKLSQEFLDFKPQILFVSLGSPWQEKFIYHNVKKISSVKLAMGIGGALDFLTGRKKRAPKLFRFLGFEWLWRLFGQPNRIKRIFNAVVIFPYRIIKNKFYCPFFYRPNVSCILYKKDKDKIKILIAERRGEPGHWQLLQGGCDGQSLMKAGERELGEEINCTKFIPKRAFKNIYKYKFGGRAGETSEHAHSRRKYTGFKGQKQGLFVAEFTGKDEDIKVNFWDHSRWKWVDVEKLEDSVHLIRKRATQKFLKKFKEMMKIK